VFELNFSTLLLATSYALPGYLFITLVLKYSFPTGATGARRTTILLASLICSTALISLFQFDWVRAHALLPLKNEGIKGLFDPQYIDFLHGKISFREILETFSSLTDKSTAAISPAADAARAAKAATAATTTTAAVKAAAAAAAAAAAVAAKTAAATPTVFASNLFLTLAVVITPLAIACAFVAVFALWILKTLINLRWRYWFGFVYLLFSYVVSWLEKVARSARDRLASSALGKSVHKKNLWLPSAAGVFVFFMMGPVFVLIFLMLLVWGLGHALEAPLWVIDQFFRLFRHPWDEVFYSFRFRKRHVIVEARVGERILYKGLYVGFKPTSTDEIGSITLTNVLQYTKIDPIHSFEVENRRAYVFEHFEGRLTIPKKEISDLHVWHFKSSEFDVRANITNEASMRNKLWYLRLILASDKAYFDMESLNFEVDYKWSLVFSKELLWLIHDNYKGWYFRPKFREVFRHYAEALRRDIARIRQGKSDISATDYQELMRQKKELVALTWGIRRIHFPRKARKAIAEGVDLEMAPTDT
jgi:nucleoid-associated protein YgaU